MSGHIGQLNYSIRGKIMREIKFNFIYGIDGKEETYFNRSFTFGEIEGGCHFDEVSDCPLLKKYSILAKRQFTGLKDKNDKEIYEGDVCRFFIPCTDLPREPAQSELHEIIWMRNAWGFRPIFPSLVHEDDREAKAFYVDPFEGDDWDTNYFEVIGNIYENPDLIK
jgi:hypothetical protein